MAEELGYSQPSPGAAVADPPDPSLAKKKKRSRAETIAFNKLARDRFEQAEAADRKQRERELDDLRFLSDPWPADVRKSREGKDTTSGAPNSVARPCLSMHKLHEPINQVLNQERESDMGLEIVPADDFGELVPAIEDTEIELREGLIRRIQRSSQAADARTWAYKRAVQAGRGYYLVMTRYVPGKTSDQEIYVLRIYNQSSVSLDPAHEQPDGSDAAWGFWGTDLPWSEYKTEYPRRAGKPNDIAKLTPEEFRALGDERKGWFTEEGETRFVRVVNYFYTETDSRTVAEMPDGSSEWFDELSEEEQETVISTHEDIQKTIKWAKLDGSDEEPLEETDWPGPDLPIVKVVGEELQPFDKERRYEGMVRPARDQAFGFDAMVSKWVESVALMPLPAPMAVEGQLEGYEEMWKLAATRTLPYRYYRTTGLQGETGLNAPESAVVEPPIQAIAESVQMFDQAIQSVTVHDPSLGKVNPALKSGKAIGAIVGQDTHGTSHYLDNLTRSMRYEAQIINGLLEPIYNRPGRLARIVNGQGEPSTVMLHQPSIVQNGRPQAAPEDPANPGQPHPQAKTYTLTKDAHFNVAIKVSKNFDTRRQQETDIVGQLLQADPQLMAVFGDLFFKNQDGPGHIEMAERAKAMLAPPVQAMLSAKDSGGAPPDPKIAELQQQLQQAQMEIQKLQPAVAGHTIQAQSREKIAQMEIESKERMAQADREVKIAVAELGAKMDRLALFMEERGRLGVQAADATSEQHQAAHEVALSAQEHQQGLQAGQQQAAVASQQADQAHQQALEQGAAGHAQALEQGQQAGDQQMAAQEAAQQAQPKESSGG